MEVAQPRVHRLRDSACHGGTKSCPRRLDPLILIPKVVNRGVPGSRS